MEDCYPLLFVGRLLLFLFLLLGGGSFVSSFAFFSSFAVDGGITVPGEFGARVGDSIVVTDDGYDVLTPYPKELCVL